MPDLVLVRNLAKGPTVFTDSATKDDYEWGGHGDPSGNDLQHIPEDVVLKNPNFRRAMDRGVLQVVEATPQVMQALEARNAQYREQQDQIAQAAMETLDRSANNDMVSVGCIGPNPRGNGICGVGVPMRADADDRPPLCELHHHLAGEFVLSFEGGPEDTPDGSKPKPVWKRVMLSNEQLPDQRDTIPTS